MARMQGDVGINGSTRFLQEPDWPTSQNRTWEPAHQGEPETFYGVHSRSCRRWFPGSAWEPTAFEVLPREAEPLAQCVPRQSLGTRRAEAGMHLLLCRLLCTGCRWLVHANNRRTALNQIATLICGKKCESEFVMQIG